MSNDKPRLRFSTIEIHNRQHHGGWHHHSPVSATEGTHNTHNTAKQQFGTRGLSGAPAPLL